MNDQERNRHTRRRVLQLIGQGAVILPVAGLAACSGGGDNGAASSAPAPAAKPSAQPAAQPEPAQAAAPAPAAQTAAMPRLMENDPQAVSLAYVHDSSTVDSAKQPRHQADQVCANCALYTGAAGDQWGGCSIFPGKLVNAAGWCSVYAPKA